MDVTIEQTPNPNALKFTVGTPVGGPSTFVAGGPVDHPAAAAILELGGVASVFMTADFVTVSKLPDADWEGIAPAAREILAGHYSD